MKLFTVTGTSFDRLGRLIVKFWNGNVDTRTAPEAGPYGIDSNPVKGMVAIYGRTELDGKEFVVGYFNKDRLAQIGETRIFSTDADGAFAFNIWLKANGEALIGDSDSPGDYTNYFVAYNKFKAEYDKTKNYLTALKNATGTLATVLDGIAPGTSAAFNSAMAGQTVGDMTQAKTDKIKTVET